MKRLIFNLSLAAFDIFLAINNLVVKKYWGAAFDAVLAVLLIVLSYDIWKRESKE